MTEGSDVRGAAAIDTAGIVLYACLAATVAFGSLVSVSRTVSIRGWRNPALIAAYGLGIAGFFVVSPLTALLVWIGAGLVTSISYGAYEYWISVRHPDPNDPHRFQCGHLLLGPVAWPLMFMEVVEYIYAELRSSSGEPNPPTDGAP